MVAPTAPAGPSKKTEIYNFFDDLDDGVPVEEGDPFAPGGYFGGLEVTEGEDSLA